MSSKLGNEYDDTKTVEMNLYDFAEGPILFYTEGCGPCIGVCIAWRAWAGIAHLGSQDEHDALPAFIAKAKHLLPSSIVLHICPVICGGDTHDDSVAPENYEKHEATILESRNVVVNALQKAGFGKPYVRWNQPGETTDLVAYLKHRIVRIESNRSKPVEYAILE